MDLKSYFTSQYLFQGFNAYISPGEKLFLFAGLVLVLLAVVLQIASRLAPSPVDSKFRQKFYYLFLTLGLSETIWFLCRWQNVRFFGSHFVAWLIALIGLIWFGKILMSFLINYRKEKSVWEKEQMKMKYLPK